MAISHRVPHPSIGCETLKWGIASRCKEFFDHLCSTQNLTVLQKVWYNRGMETFDLVLAELPGTPVQIARRIGVAPHVVRYHLRRALDRDIVARRAVHPTFTYFASNQALPEPSSGRTCAVCGLVRPPEQYYKGRRPSPSCMDCHEERPDEVAEERLRRIRLRAHTRRAAGAEAAPTGEMLDYAKLLYRDPCAYCGEPTTVLDHIEPISGGGEHAWDNLAAACGSCNARKCAKPLLVFLAERKIYD